MASIWDDFKNTFRTRNNELVQIIVINVIVFLVFAVLFVTMKLSGLDRVYEEIIQKFKILASLPELALQPWSLFTYSFLHTDPFHILFNMLFLFWFGRLIEEYIGGSRVTNLYILGGLAGGVLYIALFNFIPYFKGNVAASAMMGASGSVYAIVFGAATLLPDYTFRVLFLGDVKIKYIAFFYLVVSFIQIGGINAGGNISHIGGALMGYGYIKALQGGTDMGTWIQAILNFFKGIFRTPPPKKTIRKTSFSEATVKKSSGKMQQSSSPNPSAVGQDEIDTILDKISKSGYESLSKEEKIKLYKASRQND